MPGHHRKNAIITPSIPTPTPAPWTLRTAAPDLVELAAAEPDEAVWLAPPMLPDPEPAEAAPLTAATTPLPVEEPDIDAEADEPLDVALAR